MYYKKTEEPGEEEFKGIAKYVEGFFKSMVPKDEAGHKIPSKIKILIWEFTNAKREAVLGIFELVKEFFTRFLPPPEEKELDPDFLWIVGKDPLLEGFLDKFSQFPGIQDVLNFDEDSMINLFAFAFEKGLRKWKEQKQEIPFSKFIPKLTSHGKSDEAQRENQLIDNFSADAVGKLKNKNELIENLLVQEQDEIQSEETREETEEDPRAKRKRLKRYFTMLRDWSLLNYRGGRRVLAIAYLVGLLKRLYRLNKEQDYSTKSIETVTGKLVIVLARWAKRKITSVRSEICYINRKFKREFSLQFVGNRLILTRKNDFPLT